MSLPEMVITALLSVIGALLLILWALLLRAISSGQKNINVRFARLELNFYNFTRCSFALMAKLNPGQAIVIADAMQKYYSSKDQTNGSSHYDL